MKVLTQGHKYELESFEGSDPQVIQFIEKEQADSAGGLRTVNDGTTNEELLDVLVDRMEHLQGKHGCRENAIVITKLQECRMWLEKRTKDRVARGVEGTVLP